MAVNYETSAMRVGKVEVEEPNKHRLYFVKVHYSFLRLLLLGQIRRATSSLPDDVEVVDVGFDDVSDRVMQRFAVVLRSAEFPEVPVSNRIPELVVHFTSIPEEGGILERPSGEESTPEEGGAPSWDEQRGIPA